MSLRPTSLALFDIIVAFCSVDHDLLSSRLLNAAAPEQVQVGFPELKT